MLAPQAAVGQKTQGYFNSQFFSFDSPQYYTSVSNGGTPASVSIAGNGAVTMSGKPGSYATASGAIPALNQSFELVVPSVSVPSGASAQFYVTTPSNFPYFSVEILEANLNPGNLTAFLVYGSGESSEVTATLAAPPAGESLTVNAYLSQSSSVSNITVSLGSVQLVLRYNSTAMTFTEYEFGSSFAQPASTGAGPASFFVHRGEESSSGSSSSSTASESTTAATSSSSTSSSSATGGASTTSVSRATTSVSGAVTGSASSVRASSSGETTSSLSTSPVSSFLTSATSSGSGAVHWLDALPEFVAVAAVALIALGLYLTASRRHRP